VHRVNTDNDCTLTHTRVFICIVLGGIVYIVCGSTEVECSNCIDCECLYVLIVFIRIVRIYMYC